MASDEQIYSKLQKHLNKQPVGFPATKSGAELKILEFIFTPQQAEITTYLSYKPESVDAIYEKASGVVESKEELEDILQRILNKGGIESQTKNGIKHYCCAPLVVGMFEYQLKRLSPVFLKHFNAYASEKAFGLEIISTKLPQMRTIPIKQSITPQLNVSTYDEISSLLQRAQGPFAILECICRKKASMEDKPCKVTNRKETCLAIGEMSLLSAESDAGRIVSKDEAIAILDENQKEGLVLQPSNTKDVNFVCSCCGCCCGMLNMHKTLPKPLNYWATNFYAAVDSTSCNGCGTCESSCQVGAAKVLINEQHASIDLNRCIGCGICVTKCPTQSISLAKRPKETSPPQTKEELYDVIMENKKGKFGKFLVTGKLIYEAIRTGQTHLLK